MYAGKKGLIVMIVEKIEYYKLKLGGNSDVTT